MRETIRISHESCDSLPPVIIITFFLTKKLYLSGSNNETVLHKNRSTYRNVTFVYCYAPISYLIVHVAQHEVQQEGLALAEGPRHRHHHHVEVLDVVLQQDVLQSRLVQLKAVLLLIGQDYLDGPGHLLLCHLLEKMSCSLSCVLDVTFVLL